MNATALTFAYTIDEDDTIVSVNDEWLAFARENQASDLSEDRVIGAPLLQFVTGRETQYLYELIIEKVRKGSRLTIPFRCDGPAVRRYMELAISPMPHRQVRFEGRIVREEPRQPVALFDASTSRTEEIVVVCSWCKRVDVSGAWLEVEDAVVHLALFDEGQMPGISHGMCGECVTGLTDRVE